MKRAVRSSSSLQDTSEVSRLNDISLLRTQSIIEQDESMEFDGQSSYSSFNGDGYGEGGGDGDGAKGGVGGFRGFERRRSGGTSSKIVGSSDDSSLSFSAGGSGPDPDPGAGYRPRIRARSLKWSKSSSDLDSSHVSIHATPGSFPGRTEETKHLYIQYERRKIEAQYAKLQAEVREAASADGAANESGGGGGGGEYADNGSVVVLASHVRNSMLSGGLTEEDVASLFDQLLGEEGDDTVVSDALFYRLCTHTLRGGDLVGKYRGNSP